MTSIILSWDVKKMFKVIEDIIDGKENALITYFGSENYNKLLIANGNNQEETIEWVKRILKTKIKNTEKLLKYIADKTRENKNIQKRLKAINIT